MAGRLDPTRWSTSWKSGLTNATTRIAEGVDAVTVAPGRLAAANKEGYLAGVQRSVDKWAANVGAVSLPEWQNAMRDRGIPAIASGAERGESKVARWASFAGPNIENLKSKMPKRGATIDANIARVAFFAKGMRTMGDNYAQQKAK